MKPRVLDLHGTTVTIQKLNDRLDFPQPQELREVVCSREYMARGRTCR